MFPFLILVDEILFCAEYIANLLISSLLSNSLSLLSDCNGTRTHNHLIRKRKLNHLAKLAK